MVDLIEQSRMAVDELIDGAGRATIEAVLQLSAEQVAGARTPGQRRTGLLWDGRQAGRVCLKERKLGDGRVDFFAAEPVTQPTLRECNGLGMHRMLRAEHFVDRHPQGFGAVDHEQALALRIDAARHQLSQ